MLFHRVKESRIEFDSTVWSIGVVVAWFQNTCNPVVVSAKIENDVCRLEHVSCIFFVGWQFEKSAIHHVMHPILSLMFMSPKFPFLLVLEERVDHVRW